MITIFDIPAWFALRILAVTVPILAVVTYTWFITRNLKEER